MIQGLIGRAMRYTTQRDDPGARQAGQQWAQGRVDQAMQAAGNPQQHATREEQTRRQWMGNWVQSGDREGYREPGDLFGSQPGRFPGGIADGLRDRVMARFQNVADQQRHPSRFGRGSVFAGASGNVTQALSARHLPQSVASINSAAKAADSLAAHGMNLHPGRRR